jgi:uncharacterized SAM-binding protein YcdF (DUF218 family)
MSQFGQVDAIVVLGCAVRAGRPSPALARRAALGVRAFREGVATRIIASGGRRWDSAVEAMVIRDSIASELAEVRVEVELQSMTTVENAWYTARMMRASGANRAMLATCHWHLPRALAAFRACGVDALAPPPAWLTGPRASVATLLRERVCTWIDAAVLADLCHLG